MTTQGQGFLQRREAGLQLELAAAERRLSEHVMRYEIIEGYLSALTDMKIKETTSEEREENKAEATPAQNTNMSDHNERLLWRKRKAMRVQGLLKGGPFDQAAQSHARTSCLCLATKLQARLPRELRDLIYAYIWDDEYLGRSSGYMSHATTGTSLYAMREFLRFPDGGGPKPIVTNLACLDPDTAREALEAYYRISAHHKNFFLVRYPERLHLILHNDVFELGVLPAENLRAMDLHFTQEKFESRDTPNRIKEAEMSEQLTTLFDGISQKQAFKLRIAIIQTEIRLKQWDTILRILVPFYHAFRAEGADVRVSWGYQHTGFSDWLLDWECSIDDIVEAWTPELEWKGNVVRLLEGESRFGMSTRNYRDEVYEEDLGTIVYTTADLVR